MARMKRRHELEGFSGKVGENLRLTPRDDGRVHVVARDGGFEGASFPHWQVFKDAVAYARQTHGLDAYVETAVRTQDTPFHVATADFLSPPEIKSIDLEAYHGRPGDPIHVLAIDDVEVAEVGVLITDDENHLIEMGKASRTDENRWTYVATRQAPGHHVRVIVDAADLPGHLDEVRVEKDI